VGVVLFHPDGRVWLGRRAHTPGPHNWQFPQGGVDDGEDLLAAARRELQEETGVTTVSLLGRTEDWMAYDFPAGWTGAKAMRGWRGQKQVWFAFRFEGKDREINLKVQKPPEFDRWRWAELHEALEVVVPFKRAAYEQVIAAFAQFAVGEIRHPQPGRRDQVSWLVRLFGKD
jgi:putative (di)nucleoside polyphosphate hydrolase